ncbi:hypothetical protein MMC07_000577 [Pseudocyphellaria aurata]|nr:hypothetical protein [Pseudocyphellaria aurata]
MTIIPIPDLLAAVSEMETSVHPDELEVTEASNEWFASHKLLSPPQWSKMLKYRYGLCGAMILPRGDKTRLRVAVDWVTILFNYDDLFDDAASHLARNESSAASATKIMLSVLTDTENFQHAPSLPIAAAFLRHATAQTGHRERRVCPSVDEFVALRRKSGAAKVLPRSSSSKVLSNQDLKTFFPFVEYVQNIVVPENASQHPIIESLRDVANDLISWSNVRNFSLDL